MKTIKLVYVEVDGLERQEAEQLLKKVKADFIAEGCKHIIVVPTVEGLTQIRVEEIPLK